jgi:RimJ/RimL family protein N-acetyltransferase
VLFPHVESKRIVLRAATAEDGPKAYDILFQLGRGGLRTLDAFLENFGRGVSAHFLIHRRDTGDLVGFSALSDLSPAGHLRADVHLVAGQPEEVVTEANALTANFAFAMWRTRKVYFHTSEASISSLGFAGEYAAMVCAEAVLPDHLYFHGRRWDLHVYAIYRDQWDVHGVDLLKQII